MRSIGAGSILTTLGALGAGAFTYVFLGSAARHLSGTEFSTLSAMWSLVFILGPGLFLPIQQRLGQILGRHRITGHGAAHGTATLRRTALVMLLVAGVALAVLSPVLRDRLLGGHAALLWCLGVAVAGFGASYFSRGVLAGSGNFQRSSLLVFLESVVRTVLALTLAAAGVAPLIAFASAIAVAPFVAVAGATSFGRHLALADTHEGSTAPEPAAIGWLLAASVSAQVLMNGGPIVIQWFDDSGHAAGVFMAALIVGRLPMYIVPALQTAVMPNLAELAASAGRAAFVRAVWQLCIACIATTIVGTTVAYLLGPWLVRTMFGDGFAVGHLSMAVLTAASLLLVLGNAVASALVAVERRRASGIGWLLGAATFLAVLGMFNDLRTGVEVAYMAGAIVAVSGQLVGAKYVQVTAARR